MPNVMSWSWMLLQVLHLARRAAVQVAAARHAAPGCRRRAGACGSAPRLDQAELHVLERQIARSPGRRSAASSFAASRVCRGLAGDARSARRGARWSTSSAVSICRRFSSSAPHRLARRWLSTGVKEISTGFKRPVRRGDFAAQRVRQRGGDAHVDELRRSGAAGPRKLTTRLLLGAAGELGRVLLRGPFDQDALARADHAAADRLRLRVELRLQRAAGARASLRCGVSSGRLAAGVPGRGL